MKVKYTVRSRLYSYLLLVIVFAGGLLLNRALFVSMARAQTGSFTDTDLSPLRLSIRNFFENLSDSNKGARKALDEVLKNSPISSDEKLMTDLASRMKDINTRFGNYLSFEEVGIKSIGTDLVVMRYLYKCQNYPVVWYFTFYRPQTKSGETSAGSWSLIGLRYDSNLDIALRDSSF